MLNVVGYVRLSRDENKENYASIQAQKEIIENYANTHKLKISKFFEDDDVSGYKFNSRQAFNEMMTELEEGKIDVIICKDLSRIGRHNAHTLLFLETIKDLNKTLIAIDDNYDSSKDNDDIIGIKTWYNERYVKDLSQKIRSNIQSHMRKNEYLNQVPYGYKIDQFDNIVVDDVVKDIIQKIFQLYIEGNGFLKIARYLNQNNIPAPFERMRQIAEEEGKIYKRKSSNKWNDSTVQNILKNDFYIGIKRLGKTKREKVHGKRQLTTENQQHIFENNHEAIISPQDFYLVQEIMQKRKSLNYRGTIKHTNHYSGFLICEDCGKIMIARSQTGRAKSYICSSYKRYGKEVCSIHYIREDELNKQVLEYIRLLQIRLKEAILSLNTKLTDKFESTKKYEGIINKMQNEIISLQQEHKVLMQQKIKSIIKSPDLENLIEQQYEELEKDILQKNTNFRKSIA